MSKKREIWQSSTNKIGNTWLMQMLSLSCYWETRKTFFLQIFLQLVVKLRPCTKPTNSSTTLNCGRFTKLTHMSVKRRNFETRHFGFCIIFIQLVLKVQSFSSPANTENGRMAAMSVSVWIIVCLTSHKMSWIWPKLLVTMLIKKINILRKKLYNEVVMLHVDSLVSC